MQQPLDTWTPEDQNTSRRDFVRFVLASPFAGYAGALALGANHMAYGQERSIIDRAALAKNVFQFEETAKTLLDADTYHFIADGSDDLKTVQANRDAFDQVQIRARRLIDVSNIDTRINLLGQEMETPILLCPCGAQQRVHPDGELATARAAAAKKHTMICSTMTSYSFREISDVSDGTLWFQLYAQPNRDVMKQLLKRAEDGGAEVVVLTVDGPTLGNRERIPSFSASRRSGAPPLRMPGNFDGLEGGPRAGDASMTWSIIDWLRANTSMKVLLKGIVTWEDAAHCVENGVDGLIISNHGGRQEESLRGTLECLPEIVRQVDGRIPILIDGGFRRGTDIFKALALGATAICIGRPYLWGLASFGEDGVGKVLDILRAELVRILKYAGIRSLSEISPDRIISHLYKYPSSPAANPMEGPI